MGKRGIAPAPTALKLLNGVRPDRINHDEPRPANGEIRCPSWMSAAGKRVWRRLAPDLIAKKVLTLWDVDEFADVCELVALNQLAFKDLDKNGLVLTVVERELRDGTIVYRTTKNPNWQVARESTELLVKVGGRFGLNPSDRQQLKVGDGQPNRKPGEDLLSG